LIALDTNVLVRFLVADDADQCARATRLVRQAIEADSTLFLSNIVLAETVWVLNRSYNFTRGEIAAAIHRLLAARHLVFGARERVTRALRRFENRKGGFADYLIAEDAAAAGVVRVATFDRALLGESGFFAPE
jgi:predicted nucleic-acid-binding protein